MNRRELYSLLFALLTLTIFSSCGKDDPKPVTKTDLLVANEWRGDQVTVNGIDVSNRPEVTGQIGQIKTVRLKFNRDGTYTAKYMTNMGEQTQNGNWSFNQDETKMTFELYGEVEVKTLTENNLDLTSKIPFQGVLFNAEIKFVK
ncbi:DUF5004 domain-containing protein [Pontibacter cellulosilyticus]|uniref:Lipocalin-like domain-containing protein n=1 Tax=Pontibacter cellulosilyticus TaxID=1720253 RepID=A0A923N8F8_9BACT|nr:DUF5004 domain-containing protein [Pontibacter cellulosilyticus]MBC5992375.1 hypothetical protein [Pontibacter cellulosilyticus]